MGSQVSRISTGNPAFSFLEVGRTHLGSFLGSHGGPCSQFSARPPGKKWHARDLGCAAWALWCSRATPGCAGWSPGLSLELPEDMCCARMKPASSPCHGGTFADCPTRVPDFQLYTILLPTSAGGPTQSWAKAHCLHCSPHVTTRESEHVLTLLNCFRAQA